MQIVIISGLAGAGKSVALHALEDNNYNCVDNLPLSLLDQLIDTYISQDIMQHMAISVDARLHATLKILPEALNRMRTRGMDVRIIFLDARNDVLIKRFSETRRKHPLTNGNNTIMECIANERQILSNICDMAYRIDTSDLLASQLRNIIKQYVQTNSSKLNVIIQSFGFKFGVPIDSDFVFDVRHLPNPYYNKEISEYNGLQEPVIEFLSQSVEVTNAIDDIYKFIINWLPKFGDDSRSYVTIAIGCTGGWHRSVYIAERLAQLLNIANNKYSVLIRHRQVHHNEG